MKKTRVITYGTFDLMHYGHFNLLYRCATLNGENCELYVGVSSDNFCLEKGKQTAIKEDRRLLMVSSYRFVKKAFLEHSMAQKVEDVKKYKIDVFVLGSDYRETFPKMPEYQQLLDLGCKVVFLERTDGISTTYLKKLL